jgi:transposase
MQGLSPRCAGLDVHQKTVVACVLLTAPDGTVQQHTQPFLTMTAGLLALADWLGGYGVTPVALERSGVSWHPVCNVREEPHTISLVNPHHRKAVPGRKTEVKDAAWIADLVRPGLLRPSFIPPKPIRDLRDLLR